MSSSRKDNADQTPGSIDRRGFLTSGAAVAGAAAAISAVPAQAQEMNLSGFETIQSMLAARRGQPVTVRPANG